MMSEYESPQPISYYYRNSKFCTDSGYSEDELLGNDHRILNSGFNSTEFFEKMWTEISSGKTWKGEIKNKTKYGSFYWVHSTIIPILDKTRKSFQYLSVRFDITKHKELEILLKNKNIEVNSSISSARRIQHTVFLTV